MPYRIRWIESIDYSYVTRADTWRYAYSEVRRKYPDAPIFDQHGIRVTSETPVKAVVFPVTVQQVGERTYGRIVAIIEPVVED